METLGNIRVTRQPRDAEERHRLNHCVTHRTSYLAAKEFEEDRPLIVCSSPAGFFLGCLEGNAVVARDSEYFPDQEAAEESLDNQSWEQRMEPRSSHSILPPLTLAGD